MRQRLAETFPYVLAVVVPFAGLALAGIRATEDDRQEALRIALASLAGVVIWALLLTS